MAYKFVVVLLASAACVTVPAYGQEVGPQADGAADTGTNDIIVTAQRSAQRLQDVPVSVQVLSGSALLERGITDQRQLSTIAPTLQVQKDNNYSVRGIGTQSFASTIEGSVATAVDEVTLGSRLFNGNPLLDIDRIEVLNGPQGLLFGKNASAGLVNITTARPKIGEFGANFDMQATSSERPGENATGVQVRATLNVPVSENSALRINGVYTYQEPSIHYRVIGNLGRQDNNYRQYGARAKYLLEPDGPFSVYLVGEYFESRGVGTQFDGTYRQLAADSVNADQLAADGVQVGPDNFVLSVDAPQYRDLTTGGLQGTVNYEFGNGMTLSNTLAWKFYDLDLQIDADSTGGDGANVNSVDGHYNQYSNELRLALPDSGRLTGQLGLYFFHSKFDQQSQIAGNNLFPDFLLPNFPFCVGATVSQPSPPGCAVSNSYFLGTDKDYTTTSTSYAGFGQLNYEFSDQFSAFAGGRVTRDKVSLDLIQNTGQYFVVLGFPNGTYDQTYSNTNFSWKVGVQFKPSRDIMLFATYGRGYKGPGMNDAGASETANLTVYPETTNTFEVGVKSSWWDNKATFNISAFHTKFNNFQIQSFDPELRTFVIGNAAKVISKGIESTVQVKPVRALSLNASIAYIDTRFDEYTAAQCYPTQTDQSCVDSGTFDASGYRLTFAPKFTSTVGASFEQPVSGSTRFVAQADWYHRSKIETNVNHAPGSQIGAIDLLNASVGLRGSNWNLALYCRNCTNKVYPLNIGVESGDNSADPPRLSYIQSFGLDSIRTIGMRFGFNF